VPVHLQYYLLQRYCKQLNGLSAQLAAGMTEAESVAEGGRQRSS
jgi:hypothetical protein